MQPKHHPLFSRVPERVTIELTNSCNLSCTFCPRQYMDYPLGYISKSLFCSTIDQLYDLGTSVIVPFFRGESLLHPEFLSLISYIKKRRMSIQLATNGNLLDKTIINELINLQVDFISISVDAVDENQYQLYRKGGMFSSMIKNVDYLYTQKIALGSKFPNIQVSAVDTGMTEYQKKEFISFWKKRTNDLRIYPLHSQGGKFGSLGNPPKVPRKPCLKPFKEMVIYWDGKTSICNHDWNRHDGLSVTDNTIKQIWMSDWYKDIRQNQFCLQFDDNDICNSCDHWPKYCSEPVEIGDAVSF